MIRAMLTDPGLDHIRIIGAGVGTSQPLDPTLLATGFTLTPTNPPGIHHLLPARPRQSHNCAYRTDRPRRTWCRECAAGRFSGGIFGRLGVALLAVPAVPLPAYWMTLPFPGSAVRCTNLG